MTALQLGGYIAAAIAVQTLFVIAIAYLRRVAKRVAASNENPRLSTTHNAWKGSRDFRVIGRTFEDPAESQCSFILAPVDDAPLPSFKPGQFLTFSLAVDGPDAPGRVVRCYSLSDAPDADQYRITVKRAFPPLGKPELPAGVGSGWLHDKAEIGTVLQVRAPAGQFVFLADADAPPVFIAGGIGITPILSMLRAALTEQPNLVAYLFYGVRGRQDHAFKDVLEGLVRAHPGFYLHRHYADPSEGDVLGQDYDHAGFISLDLLKQTLPHGRYAFYICGPDPMMTALIPALLAWGVKEADIHRESFGPQSAAMRPRASATSGPVLPIGFRKSGRTIEWRGQDANILDFAERQSIAVDVGCRSGSCGMCETRLISGRVRYETKPEYEMASGHCLLCVGIPETALELDA